MSREYLAALEVAEAAERVAREREEKAAAQEEETTKKTFANVGPGSLCSLKREISATGSDKRPRPTWRLAWHPGWGYRSWVKILNPDYMPTACRPRANA